MATIDFVSIQKKTKAAIESGIPAKRIERELRQRAERASETVVTLLEKEFESHKVTKELDGSVQASSKLPGFPSGPKGGTYGNLQAYFGLTSGDVSKGLVAIKSLFNNKKVFISRLGSIFTIRVSFPNIEAYYNVTPPPEGAYPVSWLEGLEKALVKNFSKFLFRAKGIKNSRSGTGVQVDNVLRRASGFPRIPYVSDIYNKVLGAGGKGKTAIVAAIKKPF